MDFARLRELVAAYRRDEDKDHRGHRFVRVVWEIELIMQSVEVSRWQLSNCLGPPDLFWRKGPFTKLLYRFDFDAAGANCTEWWFHFQDDTLVSSICHYQSCLRE